MGAFVIASEAKQSRAARDCEEAVLDCFVASLLAMTRLRSVVAIFTMTMA